MRWTSAQCAGFRLFSVSGFELAEAILCSYTRVDAGIMIKHLLKPAEFFENAQGFACQYTGFSYLKVSCAMRSGWMWTWRTVVGQYLKVYWKKPTCISVELC